jgi:hypothetical protein
LTTIPTEHSRGVSFALAPCRLRSLLYASMASASPDFDGLRITLKSKEFPDAACPGDVA